MRSNFLLSLTAIALGFGIAGVSAAPIDSLRAGTMQANGTAGFVRPPQLQPAPKTGRLVILATSIPHSPLKRQNRTDVLN